MNARARVGFLSTTISSSHFAFCLGLSMWLLIDPCFVAALADESPRESSTSTGNETVSKGSCDSKSSEPYQISLEAGEALELLARGKNKAAEKNLKARIKKAQQKGQADLAALYLMSLMEYSDYQPDKALDYLNEVIKYFNKQPRVSDYERARLHRRLGRCYFRNKQFREAAKNFEKALDHSPAGPTNLAFRILVMEDLIGCRIRQDQAGEALVYCQRLAEETKEEALKGSPFYASSYLWALLQLSEILNATGDSDKAEACSNDAMELLQTLITMRKSDPGGENSAPVGLSLEDGFLRRYIPRLRPKTSVDFLWLAVDFEPRTVPLVSWSRERPKAAIICVHGWGLGSKAFSRFGKTMSSRGYALYSLDVRGFGAWKTVDDRDGSSYKETVNDIRRIAGFVRKRYPDLPLFILGESVGGAIVLRTASKFDGEFDGAIASVPSSQSYGRETMDLSIAMDLLDRALDDDDLSTDDDDSGTPAEKFKQMLHQNLQSVGVLNAREMVKFALFMTQTKLRCHQIHSTPVLMIHGLDGSSVKQEGTVEVFNSISNPDKMLLVVGEGDRLIEKASKDRLLARGISAWLDKQVVKKKGPGAVQRHRRTHK